MISTDKLLHDFEQLFLAMTSVAYIPFWIMNQFIGFTGMSIMQMPPLCCSLKNIRHIILEIISKSEIGNLYDRTPAISKENDLFRTFEFLSLA